ncbi:MAG: hypothetical protein ACYCT9_07900 [Leptospirillum sp.]
MGIDEQRFGGLGISSHTILSLPDLESPAPCQIDRLAIQTIRAISWVAKSKA